MAIETGSWGLIEDEVIWKVAAGADSYAGPFRFKDEEGAPIPLTGYTARCQIRRKVGGEVLADLTDEVSIHEEGGVVTMWLPAAISRGWPSKLTTAVFDAELYAPSGQIVRLCKGRVEVSPNVTVEEDD